MPYIKQSKRPEIDYYLRPLIEILKSDFYIEKEIHGYIVELSEKIKTAGDLNYAVSTIIVELFFDNKCYSTANDLLNVLDEIKLRFIGVQVPSSTLGDVLYELLQRLRDYSELNGIRGALRAIELEFYIRFVRPYEDEAIERNGDII